MYSLTKLLWQVLTYKDSAVFVRWIRVEEVAMTSCLCKAYPAEKLVFLAASLLNIEVTLADDLHAGAVLLRGHLINS